MVSPRAEWTSTGEQPAYEGHTPVLVVEEDLMGPRPALRMALVAIGMTALLTGLWAGLLRLGWPWPILRSTLPVNHGPLMVSGFLGTLIGLERAVALGGLWAYLAPLSTALGVLALIAGSPTALGPSFMTLGSLGFGVSVSAMVRRQPALCTVTLGLGALAWIVGNGLWLLGWPIYRVVIWWAGFLVLTIAGERLELSRVLSPRRGSQFAFLCGVGVLWGGLAMALVTFDLGVRLAGVGMLGLALWLLRQDIARRTVWQEGLPGFSAMCLLSGYLWLGVGGMFALLFGGVMVGPFYDALLHALFLGFAVSMIFGHAPLIFPALLNRQVPFRRGFYVHLGLLHVSLLLRMGGDLAVWWPVRQWGGLFNAVAFLLFLANTGYAMRANKSPT
jgi:hypothetical protein